MSDLSTRTTDIPEVNDYAYLMSDDFSTNGKVQIQDIFSPPELSVTVNLNSSMTATDINNTINGLNHYIPSGTNLTLQFADGTYTLDDDIHIDHFYGGGQLFILGNSGESGLHTNQAVHLDFTGSGTHGIYVIANPLPYIEIRNLKVTADDGFAGIVAQRNQHMRIWYNYIISTGKTSTSARNIYIIDETDVYIRGTYVEGSYYAIEARNGAHIYSRDNDDTGTQPNYGLRAIGASSIGKFDANQPTGSTANELSQNGSIIR